MVHGGMVYTERAEMAAVPCGTSLASAVSTPLQWIFKTALSKAIHSCRITCECSESARERRTALYKSDQQQQQQHFTLPTAVLTKIYSTKTQVFLQTRKTVRTDFPGTELSLPPASSSCTTAEQ